MRAGTIPALDQADDCLLIHPMKVFAAFARSVSWAAWSVRKKWCEFAQDAGWSPMVGSADIFQLSPEASRSLICQIPSQVIEVLPFLNARYCASWSTLGGL